MKEWAEWMLRPDVAIVMSVSAIMLDVITVWIVVRVWRRWKNR